MAHFSIESLSFSYPESEKLVLDDVSLHIAQGEYVCLCGTSGCGKTTLLRHFKTVLTPVGTRTGSVLLNDTPLDEISLRDQSALVGFVMQNPDSQIVTDKVWHELAFGLESLGVDQRTMRLRVAEMASYFGISSWFHRSVQDLSGGQKQLLNLASIMAMQPSILILDEPTSQLDPIAASDFLNTVHKLNIELGTTIIITEHRLEDVYATADRVVVMDQGRVRADGTPREVSARLNETDDAMTYALPAPVRVYYGVELDRSNAGMSTRSTRSLAQDCPLTVREGRTWLTDYVLNEEPKRVYLPVEELPNPDDEDLALRMKEVWFRYERDGTDVLRGLDLRVPEGELFAIVGGNGTGKSTTLKCACGICKPYRGSISIFGKKLKNKKSADLFSGCLAMLPQDPQNLFVKDTVREDLAEMLAGKGLSESEKQKRINEVARTCDIVDALDTHPFDLSGGEQQRAALAKILLTEPRLLLLDEPTKGIDSFFKRKLARVFAGLKESGVTIVMVSHDIEFCARFADSVSMFFDGSIVTTNAPRAFFAQNSFYTTAANRMSRNVFANAVTDEDVIELCLS